MKRAAAMVAVIVRLGGGDDPRAAALAGAGDALQHAPRSARNKRRSSRRRGCGRRSRQVETPHGLSRRVGPPNCHCSLPLVSLYLMDHPAQRAHARHSRHRPGDQFVVIRRRAGPPPAPRPAGRCRATRPLRPVAEIIVGDIESADDRAARFRRRPARASGGCGADSGGHRTDGSGRNGAALATSRRNNRRACRCCRSRRSAAKPRRRARAPRGAPPEPLARGVGRNM